MFALLPWIFTGQLDSHILFRGRVDSNTQVRYMAAQDTTLDAAGPTKAVGGATVLRGGASNVILVEFRDLQAQLGWGREIVDARLVFTQIVGNLPDSVSVREIVVPWSEGPAQIVTFGRTPQAALPTGGATYRARRDLKPAVDWQQPGAQGLSDSVPVEGATFREVEGARLEIGGLAQAMQRAYENPDERFGFALRMTGGEFEFFSSESPVGQPALVLTTRKSAAPEPAVRIHNFRRVDFPGPPKPKATDPIEQDGFRLLAAEYEPGQTPWPAKGTQVRVSATLGNLSAEPLNQLEARWQINDNWGSWFKIGQVAPPKAATTIETDVPMPAWSNTGEIDTVRLQVRNGPDGRKASGVLYLKGLSAMVDIEEDFLAAWQASDEGKNYPLDIAIQDAVRSFNEVTAPRSRFGPFPSGSFAKLNLEGVRIVPTEPGYQDELNPRERLAMADVHIRIDADTRLTEPITRFFQRRLLEGLGLVHWGAIPEPFAYMGSDSKPGRPSPAFGGILGGESRFEGMIPGGITIPAEPVENPILDIANPRPTGLLSILDVASLNFLAETRQRGSTAILAKTPPITTLRCLDANGRPLSDTQVKIYVWANGAWLPEPIVTAKTNESGHVTLFQRKSGDRNLPTPMGWVDAAGRNGWLLLEVERFTVRDYGWVSLPLLLEANLRSPNLPALFDLRFNLSNAIPDTVNLSAKRFVGDSVNSLPAALTSIVDENVETASDLPQANGGYIELDIGRDRVIGEIKLCGDQWWDTFDIYVFSTGQTINEAVPWAKERNFKWSYRNYSRLIGAQRSLTYRAAGQKIRYIRFVNRSESTGRTPKAHEVLVFGLQGP